VAAGGVPASVSTRRTLLPLSVTTARVADMLATAVGPLSMMAAGEAPSA
jgi:hypothetical protein